MFRISSLTPTARFLVKTSRNSFDFFCDWPEVIFPEEEKVVKTNLLLRAPTGCEFCISPSPNSCFPPNILTRIQVVTSYFTTELQVSICNKSSNLLFISPGKIIGQLACRSISDFRIKEFWFYFLNGPVEELTKPREGHKFLNQVLSEDTVLKYDFPTHFHWL
jgi:dUTPase